MDIYLAFVMFRIFGGVTLALYMKFYHFVDKLKHIFILDIK